MLAEEMRLDFQQQSVVQAARVMQSMRGDLIEFVEGEEALCAEEEARPYQGGRRATIGRWRQLSTFRIWQARLSAETDLAVGTLVSGS